MIDIKKSFFNYMTCRFSLKSDKPKCDSENNNSLLAVN